MKKSFKKFINVLIIKSTWFNDETVQFHDKNNYQYTTDELLCSVIMIMLHTYPVNVFFKVIQYIFFHFKIEFLNNFQF